MADHFVLLELLDPTVNAFLWRVREMLGRKPSRSPIHVTIRGPYEEPKTDVLESVARALRQDVFRIAGVGRFTNGDDQVVFFRVDSPHLRSVWWKRDYPIERFGFEPHITLYRGRDSKFAALIARFLKSENIELLCAEHRLVWHDPEQPNLLSIRVPSTGDLQAMVLSGEMGQIDVSVFDRLQEAIDHYRQTELMGIRNDG